MGIMNGNALLRETRMLRLTGHRHAIYPYEKPVQNSKMRHPDPLALFPPFLRYFDIHA